MRTLALPLTVIAFALVPTLADAASASRISQQGRLPETWDHEPGPNDHLNRFQVVYVDNHSCPAGQIEKFTAGARQLNVRSTRECVGR